MTEKVLFVPLYTRFFNAFKDGSKKIEYRTYGPRWNEKTCPVGKKVILSKGYGKYERLQSTVVKFERVGNEARIHMGDITPIKLHK